MIAFVWSALVAGLSASACEPVHLKFEGTPFARRSVQIENERIFFFRGLAHEITFSYSAASKLWCFERKPGAAERPISACLERKMIDGKRTLLVDGKPAKNFVLRDHRTNPVAALSVAGKTLTAAFLDREGKALGKRMVFKSVTRDHLETLEVRGWNCPNPKFLSCAGAELTSALESEAGSAPRLPAADLAKTLGHYRFSCNGLTEHTAEETKRAPSKTEP